MSRRLAFDRFSAPTRAASTHGIALVATLALVAITSLMLVAFVSMMQLDRSATSSYSQSLKAEQIGLGGLFLITRDLQNEMSKDATPDTASGAYPDYPLFTNVTSVNILPQPVGTNATMPSLLKISTNAPSYTGTRGNGSLSASTVSSTAPSQNGRKISTKRWGKVYLGDFPANNTAPYWIMVTRNGPTNGASMTFGATGNTLNNPTSSNLNYAIGRFAYAIYDVGGLLDVTAAGYPTTLTIDQLQAIKGTLAGANLKTVGINDPTVFTQWRNRATANTAASYLNYVTNFAVTNGFQKVYPGDTTFLTRQDLIKAAEDGVAGLSKAALPNLTTFTRARNAPSWGPTYNARDLGGNDGTTGLYAYKDKALTSTATNRFIPHVRLPGSAATTYTVRRYHDDGSTSDDTVHAGEALLQRRFSLAKLAWLTPKGPSALLAPTDPQYNAGGTEEAIQKCFGLIWAASKNPDLESAKVWQYVGPTGTTQQKAIPRLDEVAAETLSDGSKREPNFIEFLQAGILHGSLGVGFSKTISKGTPEASPIYQTYPAFQVLRIAAAIIDQYDEDSCPTAIEYNQGIENVLATGTENLPGVNTFTLAMGAQPNSGGSDVQSRTVGANSIPAVTYLAVSLWNPHQQPSSLSMARPNVRVRIKGSVDLACVYTASRSNGIQMEDGPAGYGPGNEHYGYAISLDDHIQLSTGTDVGADGFTRKAGILTTSDVAAGSYLPTALTASTDLSSAPVGAWCNTFPLGGPYDTTSYSKTVKGPSIRKDMVAYRLPDVPMTYKSKSTVNAYQAQVRWVYGLDSNDPFNVIMEFQAPGTSKWIPYAFMTGVNDPSTWIKSAFVYTQNFAQVAHPTATNSSTGIFISPLANLSTQTAGAAIEGSGGLYGYLGILNTWDTCPFYISGGDPRSIRFGMWEWSRGWTSSYQACLMENSTWWRPDMAGYPSSSFQPGIGGDQNDAAYQTPASPYKKLAQKTPSIMGNIYFPAQLARNNYGESEAQKSLSNSATGTISGYYMMNTTAPYFNTAYLDRDYLRRIGDCGMYTDSSGTTGNPFDDYKVAARTIYKPVILNRAFRSVGELGYVFRDDPWRTLDFFTNKSADSGLLDLFCLNETAAISSGVINLNGQNPLALQAVLDSVQTKVESGDVTLGKPDKVAASLVKFTSPGNSGGGPLINRNELVTKFACTLDSSNFGDSNEQWIKQRREAIVRVLGDVGQTQTWNLLIDLVAQAGKYPPNATALDQFMVEGERHYWLHVAIDRITGEILDQRIEPVSE